jgi:hypothetical protein
MAIVAKGLGQPESGSVVAAGMGAAGEPSGGGFLNVAVNVTAESEVTIAAEVVGGETPPTTPPTGGGGWRPNWRRQYEPAITRDPQYVDFTLTVEAASVATITADISYNFDDELELLLLVGAI